MKQPTEDEERFWILVLLSFASFFCEVLVPLVAEFQFVIRLTFFADPPVGTSFRPLYCPPA